jgi:SSS family solute:Na+ symporter
MAVATVGVLTHVSFSQLAETVVQRFGQAGVDPLANPRFGVTFILWMIISSLVTSALWQPIASKSLASDSPRTGRRVFIFTGLTVAGRYMIPMFWGTAALVILGPDISPSLAMPRVLGMVVPSGFLGLMIAGMLAASMSTYSAYMLAWSSVATRDIIGTAVKGGLSDRSSMVLTRVITSAIGVFLLVFGLWYEIPETAFQYIALTGAMYSAGAFGCVAGGIYWKKANSVGAYASLVLGALSPLAFLLLAGSRESLPHWLQAVTDVNVSGFLSFFLAAFGMIAGSLLTQRSFPPRALHYPEVTA